MSNNNKKYFIIEEQRYSHVPTRFDIKYEKMFDYESAITKMFHLNALNEDKENGKNSKGVTFGLNHKSWNKSIHFNNLNNINYWLEQWNLFYDFIYKKFQSYENCNFVKIYSPINASSRFPSIILFSFSSPF